ncbi:hypothetical protein LO749_20715 [Paracoccus denitrificans]|uniref:hypothetical protein n=1 Tax=Paracoccus denitrificans TaxID=266 RepID=UPI001E3B0F5A|nr:hypothetical protein [Paracoccus denitrificans]UFS66920.1 hypothetical protein LO749_20715 [Paracoccus denitrificans]
MFNTIKTKLHAFLFPAEAKELAESGGLIERMGKELDVQYRGNLDTAIELGQARSEIQALRQLDSIQKRVITSLNEGRAKADAERAKWKAAALEMEEELKSSFFEIAELNKRLEGAETRDTGSAKTVPTVPDLRLVA